MPYSKEEFEHDLQGVSSFLDLEELRVRLLGKRGIVSGMLKDLKSLAEKDRKYKAQMVNELKGYILERLEILSEKIKKDEMKRQLEREKLDVTLPVRDGELGKKHVIGQVMREVARIFSRFGFKHASGPEIEEDWYNFTALNILEDHPARQMHDTFYIKNSKKLVRTHVSSVQIRYMEENKVPPHKVFSLGKVYRADYDATHTPMFHQAEGLCVDKAVSLANLKWCLNEFLKLFFQIDTSDIIRIRPSYFPFTEPSFEVDIKCSYKGGEVIVGHGDQFLELLGCGMVHPNVLENVGLDSKKYRGFAFGIGIERLAMLKYNVPDLRGFFNSDYRWLQHFGRI